MLNSKRNLKTFLFLSITTAYLMIQFQNCSKAPQQQAFDDSKVAESLSFFDYRYDTAPSIYFEIQMVPDSEDATYKTYKLLGFAANSDASTNPIDYSIIVYNPDGTIICSERTGTLTGGETAIDESCVLNKTITLGKAVLKVRNSGGDWYEYSKIYNN